MKLSSGAGRPKAGPVRSPRTTGATGAQPTRRVAFLRAINVGGHTVRMEQLRALFTAMGFADVETFIASGNVIFSSDATDVPALERRIEAALGESLGYAVAAFVRSIEDVQRMARYQPFPESEPGIEKSTIYVILLARAPTPAARTLLLAVQSDVDAFAVKGREIYWRHRGKLPESPFSGAQLERTTGGPATMRNRNTIVRLADRYGR